MKGQEQTQQKKLLTLFGSSKQPKDSLIFKEAEKLGYEMCKRDFNIRSGGQDNGQGIMTAISQGAERANKELNKNNEIQAITMMDCVWNCGAIKECTSNEVTNNIGVRTEKLCQGSTAFVGGKGTLLELIYLLNMKTFPKSDSNGNIIFDYVEAPVYVYGTQWKSVLYLLCEQMNTYNLNEKDLEVFKFVDTVDQMLEDIDKN